MKNKVCIEPSVIFHGSKYVPGDELNDGRYPFTLCPECMSSETMVIDKCYEQDDHGIKYTVGDKTGDTYRRWRDSIFYDKVRSINYRCKDCGCQYTTYEKLESGVRPPVLWFILCSMLTALSLFFVVSSIYGLWGVPEGTSRTDTDILGIIFLLSAISFVILLMFTIVNLSDI